MNAIIGIPVYKEKLNILEMISLQQVEQVMKSWKKVFIAPQSLKIEYGAKYKHYEVIRFDDFFFQSINSYSELLLTEQFYERFKDYTFLLIYQLDAFVFSDRLQYFCDLGYDFIGAPACKGNWRHYHVGNGGFSLRNILGCLRVVREKQAIIKKLVSMYQPSEWGEDDFFAFCGKSKEIDFKVPSPRLAATFSAQSDYAHGLRAISQRGLPFGCHYWTSINYSFWKPHIETFGYSLPMISTNNLNNGLYPTYIIRMLLLSKLFIRDCYIKGRIDLLEPILPRSRSYCIWGGGEYGNKCMYFFRSLPIKYNIVFCYDIKKRGTVKGLRIVSPKENILKKKEHIIIIATLKFEAEIRKRLIEHGLEEKKDFWSFCSLIELLGERYVLGVKYSESRK